MSRQKTPEARERRLNLNASKRIAALPDQQRNAVQRIIRDVHNLTTSEKALVPARAAAQVTGKANKLAVRRIAKSATA